MGIEAHAYIPGSSNEAQFAASLRHLNLSFAVDVGANTGQFGLDLLRLGFDGPILSVEPLREAHARLVATAAPHPRWSVADCTALGACEGSIEFHVAANSVSSSALAVTDASIDAAPASRHIETRSVPVTTIDTLMQRHALPNRGGLLKIDTQGYEWQVLDGAAVSLEAFDAVLLELSMKELYAGQHLWRDLVERMDALGFGLWFLQPEFIDPHSGRTLQMNGLFARNAQPATGVQAGA